MITAFTDNSNVAIENAPSSKTAVLFPTNGSESELTPIVAQQWSQYCDVANPAKKCSEPGYALYSFNTYTIRPNAVSAQPIEQANVTPQGVDTYAQTLRKMINLPAKGGGDCQDPVYSGIIQTLEAMEPDSYLRVFTDASAADADRQGEMEALATSKNIRVEIVPLGSCSPIDPSYFPATEQTGG
jgi:hypothetical protein